jgi:hypothetical protein
MRSQDTDRSAASQKNCGDSQKNPFSMAYRAFIKAPFQNERIDFSCAPFLRIRIFNDPSMETLRKKLLAAERVSWPSESRGIENIQNLAALIRVFRKFFYGSVLYETLTFIPFRFIPIFSKHFCFAQSFETRISPLLI